MTEPTSAELKVAHRVSEAANRLAGEYASLADYARDLRDRADAAALLGFREGDAETIAELTKSMIDAGERTDKGLLRLVIQVFMIAELPAK